jgi:ATP-dependent Lon protease
MPEAIKKQALEELDKLTGDTEGRKIQTWLEWLIAMPWTKRTEDQLDLAKAQAVLDASHSGLDSVKERIIEFLAVRKKTKSKKGAILCFTGPAGTGKTSVAEAIADAMGRKFERFSLGGVKDETLLRGHNRTYVGAQPGNFIQMVKRAGSRNPVILLDEVDKLEPEVKPVLLEVLDPKQNDTFQDHYLNVPFDMSEAIFIVTANYMDKIPPELFSRMEVIEFSGYTVSEKLAIAKNQIIPKKQKENGVTPEEARLDDGAIRRIIGRYTAEAGVRKLEQQIDAVMRKVAAWMDPGTKNLPAPGLIKEDDVEKYLGSARGERELASNGVGVATALAVNDLGGSTFNLEIVSYPGNGAVHLRKQMQEQMQDSVSDVMAYVHSMADKLGVDESQFKGRDFDISFPIDTPIDGPSAGVTLATALVSRMSGRPVKGGIAMTGKIDMIGRVLPIGGLKEKAMAAHRAGYHTVIYPAANQNDADQIPEEVRREMTLIPVKTVDQVLANALEEAPQP